jgi:hypothetical protein
MLKSAAATAVMGIAFGILATAGLAVSPSAAQQLRTSVPCLPMLADWTRCRYGRFERCTQIARRQPSTGECVLETHCKPAGRACTPRPRPS